MINTNLAKKVTCIAVSAALACGMVPAASLTLMSTPDEALAATKTEGCRTNRVIEAYLTQNADGTYSLDRSKLTTREQWKDLGIAGFFLYAGYDAAADLLLNPWNYTYLNNQEADINRHLQMDNLGAATDASAYDNMAVTYQLVNDLNLCRQEENRSEGTALADMKISPELVAWEVRAVNFSSTIAFDHCECNPGSDIIASDSAKYVPSAIDKNYQNPFYGWYFEEKEAYQQGVSRPNGMGHYQNIITTSRSVAGGAKAAATVKGINNHTYGVNMANDKRVASQGWTVMEIADYQKALDAYMSFVESQPSVAGSGLDGNTSAGDSGTTTKPQAPKPTFKYPDSYTWGTDPDTTSAQTYPTFTATGSAITVSPIITLDGKVLTEGVDYTLSYVSNVNPGKATWTAKSTSTTASWVLTDDFIITKAPVAEDTNLTFGSFTTYKKGNVYIVYGENDVRYEMPKAFYTTLNQGSKYAAKGWHKINGHDYYVFDAYGSLVFYDTTIDDVKYQAVYDEPTQTYYLEKVIETTSPDPVTPADPSEKPTEPSTPSGGDNTGTDKPVTPTEPEKPSGGSDKPSTGGDTPTNPGTTNPGGNTGNTEKPTTPVNPGGSTPINPGTDKPVTPTEPAKPAEPERPADPEKPVTPPKPVLNGFVTTDGKTYYYVNGNTLKGWQTLSGKKYYFGSDGAMYIWGHTIGSDYYYFNGNGVMHTGWLTWNADKSRSYFASNGKMLKGWQTISGKKYYFNSNGRAVKWSQTIGGNKYYFNSDGSMHKGWLIWSANKKKSYFNSNGIMVKWTQKIGGKTYYFDGNGYMHTGWLTWSKDKSRSYFNKNGVMLTGWQKISGKWYYFNGAGKMQKNWLKTGGKWYYLGSNGQMRTGWQKISKKWYYFKGGNSGQMVTGWQKISGKWYYFQGGNSGKMLTGWQKISKKWYYFDSSGKMRTGWVKIGKYKYQFKSNGVWTGKKRRR